MDYLQAEREMSQRAACKAMSISRSSYAYQPDTDRDRPVIEALHQLAEKEPTYGFGLMFDTLHREGKPTQNSFVERFNRTYRTEVLDLYLFSSLSEVRDITESWNKKYNEERPHQSLSKLTPAEYRLNYERENSNTGWH